ncbi:hypothetical protein BJ085DRAFT_41284 [Dimargaris cristalligena]|uniref:Pentacotripeptide-repeat region of PRORP domain-containing protein n=1 Tax=Dimargaris cristalligena TaxID=215637 RepID=A0A4P9ZUZ7_9FUNG|nr:hypothetical protein BJ085DRAFT_41284 [Dimargaris cristalligena]|eukprot:RKP37387.1 hypothetical protein BJ085DRAFT_41284 [Dimargaris cristalligena]
MASHSSPLRIPWVQGRRAFSNSLPVQATKSIPPKRPRYFPNKGYDPPLETQRQGTLPLSRSSKARPSPSTTGTATSTGDGVEQLGFLKTLSATITAPPLSDSKHTRPSTQHYPKVGQGNSSQLCLFEPDSFYKPEPGSNPDPQPIPAQLRFTGGNRAITSDQFRLATLVFSDAEALWSRYQRLKESGQNRMITRSTYNQLLTLILKAGVQKPRDIIGAQTQTTEPGTPDQLHPEAIDRNMQLRRIESGEYFTRPPTLGHYGFNAQWRERIEQLCRDWVSALDVSLGLEQRTHTNTASISGGHRTDNPNPVSTVPEASSGTLNSETSAVHPPETRPSAEPLLTLDDLELIVCALMAAERPDQAWECIERLAQRGIVPAAASFDYFFSYYARTGQYQRIYPLMTTIKQWNLIPRVFHYGILVHISTKDPRTLPQADRYLDEMKAVGLAPNAYIYGPLLIAHTRLGHRDRARELSLEILQSPILKDVQTYNMIIWALGHTGQIDALWRLYFRMRSSPLATSRRSTHSTATASPGDRVPVPDHYTYSILFSLLMKRRDSARLQILKQDWLASSVGWNPHICSQWMSYWCENGHLDAALKMLRLMPSRGINPTAINYLAIITGLCQTGQADEALKVLDTMDQQGLAPTVNVFNRLIESFAGRGDSLAVSGLRRRMRFAKIREDASTQNAILKGLVTLGRLRQAADEFEYWVSVCHKDPSALYRPNHATYYTMIPVYIQLKESIQAVTLVRQCHVDFPDYRGSVWIRFAQTCYLHRAPEILKSGYKCWKVLQSGTASPNARSLDGTPTPSSETTPSTANPADETAINTYTSFLNALSGFGKPWARACLEVWKDMKASRGSLNHKSVTILLKAAQRLGQRDRVDEVVAWARESGLVFSLLNYHQLLTCRARFRQTDLILPTLVAMGESGLAGPQAVGIAPTRETFDLLLSLESVRRNFELIDGITAHLTNYYPHVLPIWNESMRTNHRKPHPKSE